MKHYYYVNLLFVSFALTNGHAFGLVINFIAKYLFPDYQNFICAILQFITINGNDHLFYSKVSLFAKNNFPNFGLNLPSELCLIVEQLENTIRWRINNGRLQSNARLVKWDDGSMSLVLGDEVHDCTATDLTKSGATRQLLVKKEDGLGYEARQSFAQQLTFKASNLSGRTQQRLMQKAWSQARAANRTRATVVIENPEDLKRRALKEVPQSKRPTRSYFWSIFCVSFIVNFQYLMKHSILFMHCAIFKFLFFA